MVLKLTGPMHQAECGWGHVIVRMNDEVVRTEMVEVGVNEVSMIPPDGQGVCDDVWCPSADGQKPMGSGEGEGDATAALGPPVPPAASRWFEGGADVIVPNFTGVEIVAALLMDDREKFLSSSVCGSHILPGGPAESMLSWNMAKFAGIAIDQSGLQGDFHGQNKPAGANRLHSCSQGRGGEERRANGGWGADGTVGGRSRRACGGEKIGRKGEEEEQELDSVPSLRSLLAMLPPEPNVLVDEWTRLLKQAGAKMSVSDSKGREESGETGREKGGETGGEKMPRAGADEDDAKVAVCLSGAMRGSEASLIQEMLFSKLPKFDLFAYILNDGTAPSGLASAASSQVRLLPSEQSRAYKELRARSSCGSTGCWRESEQIVSTGGEGAFRHFHNGTRAF
ncbi:hypothetical protein GUITHDRAFT_143710 [Guillardia theta CCMP2712]|uniref:Uncharacterized protein n=1 Tax=Guillardia theta (strain CCMP2712) TaxID=905079 RepID=L1IT70_GUITC|nr:hypothetical protein GUITHDRAFT_143710 [Guillardia theta CCMP2712]EKX39099.1 hypothetical protein GUITHDRAFT_143710 [Guillardia theta CCMP2712]|eukprot:XP_005826079.1 hypothetical protein GUITHDRAFT_143710 [Guillardia theta CCMP2712]